MPIVIQAVSLEEYSSKLASNVVPFPDGKENVGSKVCRSHKSKFRMLSESLFMSDSLSPDTNWECFRKMLSQEQIPASYTAVRSQILDTIGTETLPALKHP